MANPTSDSVQPQTNSVSTLPNSNSNFWTSATGHAIIGALVTCGSSVALALAQSPDVQTILGGGLVATAIKYIVDLLRVDIPNL